MWGHMFPCSVDARLQSRHQTCPKIMLPQIEVTKSMLLTDTKNIRLECIGKGTFRSTYRTRQITRIKQ